MWNYKIALRFYVKRRGIFAGVRRKETEAEKEEKTRTQNSELRTQNAGVASLHLVERHK
jgi:hypothetical protein